jgi:formylglycine-generating enzyme required for sulfatase activity
VVSGAGCMDKYEASVWRVPNPTTVNKFLVGRIRGGKATAADLAAGGATQLGLFTTNDYPPCGANGNCADVFAVSIPGVLPSANITWFQAEEACANSGKRMPTSAEWQVAAHGSPDPGPDNGTTDCNTTGVEPTLTTPTGSRSGCVSTRGAFDMVGNVAEYPAGGLRGRDLAEDKRARRRRRRGGAQRARTGRPRSAPIDGGPITLVWAVSS